MKKIGIVLILVVMTLPLSAAYILLPMDEESQKRPPQGLWCYLLGAD